MKSFFSLPPYKTYGGAHIPHHKITARSKTITMPAPDQVVIPMLQNVGVPCKPTVKRGDHVYRGQKIGDSEAAISAPIHASISGSVSKIEKIMLPGGQVCDAVYIDSDGLMESSRDLTPPIVSNAADFALAIRESGLVGLGGAGFPAYVKLQPAKPIDTLIINSAECEPYVTSDNRCAIEEAHSVLEGIYAIKSILDVHRVIIAVEDNKPDVIAILKEIADDKDRDPNDEVKILPLKSRYPQGAEKTLIKSCTNREVPPLKLPADVGCIVMNITSVAFIANYLKTGMPLVSKRITVSGNAVSSPNNVLVPIGTKISDIIGFCGGFSAEPKKILLGGPMMGTAIADISSPILKQNNSILIFDEKSASLPKPSSCIRCGKCVQNCPMHLVPTMIEKAALSEDTELLKKYNVNVCMECGTCAYGCPANRRLVESIRIGKSILREANTKKKG